MNTQPIKLVYNADDNFAMGLVASLFSVMDNLGSNWSVQSYIIDGGLSDENKKKIKDSLPFNNLEINWLNISPEQAKKFSEMDELPNRWPLVVNYRLLMPELLPDSDRAIYLDADTLVLGDLSNLWTHEMGDNSVCMTRIPGVKNVASRYGMKDYDIYGIDQNTPYYCSGVLLANLSRLRSSGAVREFMQFLTKYQETVAMPDQDAIQVVLNGNIGELHASWQMIIKGGRARLKHILAKMGLFEDPINTTNILHYTERKPWEFGCLNIYRSLFFHYLDKTLWSGWRPDRKKDLIEQLKFSSKKIRSSIKARFSMS